MCILKTLSLVFLLFIAPEFIQQGPSKLSGSPCPLQPTLSPPCSPPSPAAQLAPGPGGTGKRSLGGVILNFSVQIWGRPGIAMGNIWPYNTSQQHGEGRELHWKQGEKEGWVGRALRSLKSCPAEKSHDPDRALPDPWGHPHPHRMCQILC